MRKITIIGAGPGGYVAALKGAILGAEVTLVEKDRLGGTCLNRGCIPTKAFLKSAEVYEEVQTAGTFGVSCSDVNADYAAIKNRKDVVVNQLVGGIKFLLIKKNVHIVQGVGKLVTGNKVEITKPDSSVEVIESDAVILANGSIPVIPSMFNYDGDKIITSDELLRLKELPKSMIIVGGGVIGCEFGQFYRKLGTDVTIIEMAEHILPNEDIDVASVVSKRMKMQGVKFYTGIGVTKVEKKDGLVTATIATGEELSAEYMLLSIGRKANIERILDEAVDIMMEKGKVIVNDKMETSKEGVYAIGDLVDTPLLAHVASREATCAVENIMGRDSHMVYHAVPRCLYTNPEIGAVGLTEAQAQKEGIKYNKGIFTFAGIGKALVIGQTEGFVKILVDENDKIIGAAVVGPEATDLLTELTLAVHLGLTAKQVGEIIHPHPTLSEALMEALHDVHNESVHAF